MTQRILLQKDKKVFIAINKIDYQELLKSLVTPKDGLHEELAKSRSMENKWKLECQELVKKLDFEVYIINMTR